MTVAHWADPAMWEPATARPGVPWRHGWDITNVAPYGQAPRYATELKGNQP